MDPKPAVIKHQYAPLQENRLKVGGAV